MVRDVIGQVCVCVCVCVCINPYPLPSFSNPFFPSISLARLTSIILFTSYMKVLFGA